MEKILKSYYVFSKEENPPYTHNLIILAKKSGIYSRFSEKQKDIIDILDPLNVEARYPSHKEKLLKSLNEKRCKKIFENTKELYQWIKKKLLKN
ncbi:MAG: HEPN domain-containing protein [Spirochaetes bacterium]|nr:HEPN domain-containing protein [Spirochaetota bacterium]